MAFVAFIGFARSVMPLKSSWLRPCCILTLSFSAVCLEPPTAARATDVRCPPLSCCDEPETKGRCFHHPFWTEAYCCARGPAADCYRWREDSPGHDLEVHPAHSGPHCRHLCQSHERCAYWTYLVDVPQLPEFLRGRCFLKSQAAINGRIASHEYVLSGERLCAYFGEGLSAADAQARSGLELDVPWRTSAGKAPPGYNVLPAAGTQHWAAEAAEVFNALGFVVILDALGAVEAQTLRKGAEQVAQEMLARDPLRVGNRGPRRYSFGGASKTLHLMHMPGWPRLLDNGPVTEVLKLVFPRGYHAAGGGGDFVLGGTSTYQSLHLDVGGGPIYDLGEPPAVGVNYIVDDHTCAEGPLRIVPGSHLTDADLPDLKSEPEHVKKAVLCPLPVGAAIVRDLRAWHGGTPNGADRTRYLPNAEFVGQVWGSLTCGTGVILDPCQPVMPRSAHEGLSAHGRAISAGLVDDSGALEASVQSSTWMHHEFAECYRHRNEAY